jgi:hypothetical protein
MGLEMMAQQHRSRSLVLPMMQQQIAAPILPAALVTTATMEPYWMGTLGTDAIAGLNITDLVTSSTAKANLFNANMTSFEFSFNANISDNAAIIYSESAVGSFCL